MNETERPSERAMRLANEERLKELTNKVFLIATQIAADAPHSQGEWSRQAKISWTLINELREVLDTGGIPWRKVKR